MWKQVQPKDKMCSAEIPVREDKRGDEGPEVEAKTQPAGAHLHPHSRHSALHGLRGGVWSEGDRERKIQFREIVWDIFNLSTIGL